MNFDWVWNWMKVWCENKWIFEHKGESMKEWKVDMHGISEICCMWYIYNICRKENMCVDII